jgi:hypothetical protein
MQLASTPSCVVPNYGIKMILLVKNPPSISGIKNVGGSLRDYILLAINPNITVKIVVENTAIYLRNRRIIEHKEKYVRY